MVKDFIAFVSTLTLIACLAIWAGILTGAF